MKNRFDRRSFLKRAALAAGALSAQQIFPVPNILHAASVGEKVRCVIVGCGVRGGVHLNATAGEHLVALVDVDDNRLDAFKKKIADKGRNAGTIETFTDYRRMFDKLHKQTRRRVRRHAQPPPRPCVDDRHAVGQERLLRETALPRHRRGPQACAKWRASTRWPPKWATRAIAKKAIDGCASYVWAGVIGKITETHCWCDRTNGGVGPRPPTAPVPAGMHWDEWIGPAPYRDFHSDLHPHEWHGWYDFGNGSLGNLACHVMDGAYWSLKIEHPESVELEAVTGGTDERCPVGTRIRWDCPARGDMPPLKVYWYDGYQSTEQPAGSGEPEAKKKAKGDKRVHYLPPLLVELQAKYPDEKFESNGTLYVGEKGILYTGCYGGNMHHRAEGEDGGDRRATQDAAASQASVCRFP